jgi:predicted signal transduction protein with EAL and GGDEF domain
MMIEFTGELAIFYLHQGESKSAAISRLFTVWINQVVDFGHTYRKKMIFLTQLNSSHRYPHLSSAGVPVTVYLITNIFLFRSRFCQIFRYCFKSR